jgi:putative membrane protein
MLVRLLVGWALLALTFFVVTLIVPGIRVTGGAFGFVVTALVFGLVNSILGTALRVVTLPLKILTLGLFALVLNAALLALVAWLTPALTIDGVLSAVIGALLISIISALFNAVIGRAVRMAT